jgi:flagellar basal body-associated protein FliL
MADKEKPKADAKPEGAAGEAAPKKKGGLPIKTIAIVAVVMALEAGALVFLLGLGSPKASKAEDGHELVHDDSNELEEVEIIADETFQNMQTGQVWVWGISIYAQVKKKNVEFVDNVLGQRQAEVREGISQIVGRAQHTQLKEPDRQTLNRQVSALLEKVIKPDEDGKARIERLIISKCTGYPADF